MIAFKTYTKHLSKQARILLSFLALCFLMLLANPMILSNIYKPLSTIILTISIIGTFSLITIITIFRNNNFLEGVVTNGTIEFDELQLHFKGQSFNYSDITDLHIFYAGYPRSKDQIHVYRTGNFINFTLNKISHKIYFLIEDEQERLELVKTLKELNKNKISFKESTSRGQSYFLDINLKHNEIQEFKAKYYN